MFRSASSSPQPTPVPSLPLARASLPAGETGTEWKRGRASVRCSNATTPTISNEPTSGRDHIVLGVPFIALPTEPLHSFSRRDYFRNDAFDDFKTTADCENDRHR